MIYARFLVAELRRRPGRTALTVLGLAIGVGLVVVVGALSAGLDDAQEEVLEPLAGLGTDMRVSRPLAVPSGGTSGPPDFSALSEREQRRLKRENPDDLFAFEPGELGSPGERFTTFQALSSDLSFPESTVARVARLDGVVAAVPALSLQTVRIEGDVPEENEMVNPHASYDITSLNVTGVEVGNSTLAPVTQDQLVAGSYFSPAVAKARGQVILDAAYARQNRIGIGDRANIGGKRLQVIGLAAAPLGGAASNAYVELGRLQELTDREGRVNVILARARSTAAVDSVRREITGAVPGGIVTTATDLAERIGGSLSDAKDLSSTLGAALAAVALGAAFLVAAMLALSGVQRRTRELGTLKALGWRRLLVVRQVSAESVVQGVLGGLLGALIGVGGAALLTALNLSLDASVAQAGAVGFFGQGEVTSRSAEVVIGAPVDLWLLLSAIALSGLGGLLAAAAGGLKAARLRPAEALRSVE